MVIFFCIKRKKTIESGEEEMQEPESQEPVYDQPQETGRSNSDMEFKANISYASKSDVC